MKPRYHYGQCVIDECRNQAMGRHGKCRPHHFGPCVEAGCPSAAIGTHGRCAGHAGHRWVGLRSLYGISRERYEAILAAQGGVCAICRKPDFKNLCVDHDHSCCPGSGSCGACIRGLLCRLCNVWLGRIGDDAETVERAHAYLDGGYARTGTTLAHSAEAP